MEGEQLLRMWRRRMRFRGIWLAAAGVATGMVSFLMMSQTEHRIIDGVFGFVVSCFGGLMLVAFGALLALRLPIFLRRPELIARVDLHSPGNGYHIQVVLEDGRTLTVSPPRGPERHKVALALEQSIGFARLRARVV